MSEASGQKVARWWIRPALAIAVIAGVSAFLWWPSKQDGELIVSLPVSSRNEVSIDLVPQESGEVCVRIVNLFSNPGSESWLVDVHRRKPVKLDLPPNSYFPNVLSVRGNTVIYRDPSGVYAKPRRGGKPRLLVDAKVLFTCAGANVVMRDDKNSGSAQAVWWLLDLRTGRKKAIALTPNCVFRRAGKGNAATPVMLVGTAPDEHGTPCWHVWLADSEGRIKRDVLWPGPPHRLVRLDAKGNLYILKDQGLWVHEAQSRIPHKLAGFSPRERGHMMDGTQQGAFVGVRHLRAGETWIVAAINSLSKAGQKRAVRLLTSASYPYWRLRMDVWYYSPTGRVRRRVARRVDSFAASPEGDTMYFMRGRELRCVKLSEESSMRGDAPRQMKIEPRSRQGR